jgi:hypothetical protein
MTNTTTEQPQTAFDEEPLNDATLEQQIEDWAAAKERLKGPRKAYNALNTSVKELIDQKELPNGTYRCGKYVITVKPVESREIAFERTARKSITIKPAKTQA